MQIRMEEAMKKESMKNKETNSKKPVKDSDIKRDMKSGKKMVKKACVK